MGKGCKVVAHFLVFFPSETELLPVIEKQRGAFGKIKEI